MIRAQEFIQGLGCAIQEALNHCIERENVPPLHFVLLAVNGSLMAVRADGESRETLTQHHEPEGWRFPVTMLVVDSKANGSTFILRAIGIPLELTH